MYALKARFFPAQEPKGGYIGRAYVKVANAVFLNNISVFENDEGTRSIAFAKFGKDNERSYIIPSSKEVYAALLEVVNNAVDNDKHVASEKGEYGVQLKINGARVNEAHADGRYSVVVGDFCTLNGISTKEASYEKDGESKSFVAVDFPTLRDEEGHVILHTDEKGDQHAILQFDFLKDKYTNKEGKEVSTDYKALANNMIRKYRKELASSLDNTIDAANAKKEQRGEDNFVPNKEQTR